MKAVAIKKLLLIPAILLFFLLSGFSSSSAENRTPPYTGWKPEGPFKPFSAPKPRSVKKASEKQATKEKPLEAQSVEKPLNMEGFRTEEYVVRDGDWIAKILREKGVLKTDNDFPRLLEMLRKLNRSMTDLDLIKPGEKIVILVKVGSEVNAKEPREKPKPVRETAPLPREKPQRAAETPALPPETKEIVAEAPPLSAEAPEPVLLKISTVKLSETRFVSTFQGLRSESYQVKEGDMLSSIVRERYGLSSETFASEYLDLFKKCNPSIEDPDRILAGQKVNLPLYPPQWYGEPPLSPPPAQPPIMRDLAGSSRVRLPDPQPVPEPAKPAEPQPLPAVVARQKPETAQKQWISKKTAPSAVPKTAEAPLPPSLPPVPVDEPIKAEPPTITAPESAVVESSRETRETTVLVSKGLGIILPQMDEQWIHTGEHFIPMKSGGNINLKADTYPIIKRQGGMTLIVDLNHSLPTRMGKVIEASWGTYRIVTLSPTDDLRSAFGKILEACQYPKVFKKGEPLKLSGAIPVTITGDWIVIPPRSRPGTSPGFIVIDFLDDKTKGVPRSVKAYLKGQGVLFVEYPSPETPEKPLVKKAPETAPDAASLVEMVLTLTGQPHEARVKIPAFESRNDDFRLTVTADFYLTGHGRERVIDLSGLEPEVVALLKERNISVLSLSTEHNPLAIVSKTLKFLGWAHNMGPLILATAPHGNQNVKLTLSGVVFSSEKGHSVFVTPINLPPELAVFLYEKGYRVVTLAAFSPLAGINSGWGG